MESVQKITLDILNNRTYEQVYSKQYDKGRVLKIKLVEDGAPINLSEGTVCFKAKKPDNTVVYNNCIIDSEKSEITIELTEQLTALPGKIPFEIEIKSKSDKIALVYLDDVPANNYTCSILNQLSQNIISSGNNSNPYKLCSDMTLGYFEGVGDGLGFSDVQVVVKSGGVNKIFDREEPIPSNINFKDIVIYSSKGIKNFMGEMEYTGATIVKTVSGTLNVEKAIVIDGDIESTSEFTALQAALSSLAIANAEAKEYYEEMQEISGIKSSATEPTDERISVWIKTSNTSNINLPEIKDSKINLTDTWSSQKILQTINSGGTIDSNELNSALAEILV